MSTQLQRAAVAAARALEQHPDAGSAFAVAAQDPVDLARLLAGILYDCHQRGADEIPLEQALRAGVAVHRLRGAGVGLEALLGVALAAIAAVAEDLPGEPAADLGRALVLVVTRSYLDAEANDNREQQKRLRALIAISRAVNSTLDPEQVAEAGLEETLAAMGLDAGAIWLGQAEGLSLVRTAGVAEDLRQQLLRLDVGANPVVRGVLGHGQVESFEMRDRDSGTGSFRSALMVPLIGAHDHVGLLAVGSRRVRHFDEAEIGFATAVGEHLTAALDHAFEHRREAHTDYLTGLANRAEFETAVRRQLAAVSRHRRPLSLLLLDLDRLKEINDQCGHHAGDEAIRTLAQVVGKAVRTSDISARLGGDEFAVAMPDTGLKQARDVVARIHATLASQRLELAPGAQLAVSSGVVAWEDGQDYQALFDAADEQLYSDKREHHARRA